MATYARSIVNNMTLQNTIDAQHADDCLDIAEFQLSRALRLVKSGRLGLKNCPARVKTCKKLVKQILEGLK